MNWCSKDYYINVPIYVVQVTEMKMHGMTALIRKHRRLKRLAGSSLMWIIFVILYDNSINDFKNNFIRDL